MLYKAECRVKVGGVSPLGELNGLEAEGSLPSVQPNLHHGRISSIDCKVA